MILSILVPTYNSQRTIVDTINSCIKQSQNQDIEIIIVDNCSKDRTHEILMQNYGSNPIIKIFQNNKTVSMYENHNICIKKSKGEYLIFCHSDDKLEYDCVRNIKIHLSSQNYPRKYIFWGYSLFNDPSNILTKVFINRCLSFGGQNAIAFFLERGITPSGTVYSSDIKEYGCFLETEHRLAVSDSATMVLFALRTYKFRMIDELLVIRSYTTTSSVNKSNFEVLKAYNDVYNALFKLLGNVEICILKKTITKYPLFYLSFISFISSSDKIFSLKVIIKKIFQNPYILFKSRFYLCLIFIFWIRSI